MMKWKIDLSLLPVKAYYFLLFAATAPVVPFIPIYAKQLGFDEISVGIILAVMPFAGMLAKPTAGVIADKWAQQKAVFMLSILLTGFGYSGLQLVSDIEADNPAEFVCSSPMSLLRVCRDTKSRDTLIEQLPGVCSEVCKLSCTIDLEEEMDTICSAFNNQLPGCRLNNTISTLEFTISSNLTAHDTQPVPECLLLPVDNFIMDNNEEYILGVTCDNRTAVQCQAECHSPPLNQFVRRDSIFTSVSFWIFFLILILAYSSFSVAGSMGDAICFYHLGDRHHLFGSQRVWGSIGWGLFTIVAGYLVDTSDDSNENVKDFTPAILLMGGLLLLCLLVCVRMKISCSPVHSNRAWKDMLVLLSRPRVLMFVIWCLICGILTSTVWNWLVWYLVDLAKATGQSCSGGEGDGWVTLLLGINMGVQCFVGEVPMFFLSGRVITTLGHTNTMTLVLGAFGLRLLLYSYLTNPWLSLPIEILNGVTFGIFYSTMTSYAHLISPPGLESTMQGLVGATYEGAGVAIGSLVGGTIYKTWGGALMYRAFGLVSIVACLLHGMGQIVIDRYTSKEENNKEFEVVATFDEEPNCNNAQNGIAMQGR